MSDRASSFSERTCSGLMYSGVPIIWAVAVIPDPSSGTSRFAMPKSMRRTEPAASSITLPALRSRWMIPASWMACSASATWIATSNASAVGSRPRWRRIWRRLRPSTYSMTMNRSAPAWPYSWMPHTFRWRIRRASLISERKRRAASSDPAISVRSSLIATTSSSSRSRAR